MRSGTQTVEKAIALLVALARRTTGWRLSDLARECDFDLATTHRLLRCMAGSGLVVKRLHDRHFFVGPELYNMGIAATYHAEFIALAKACASETASSLRHVTSIFLRSGNDFVCIARAGRSPLKGLSIEVGTRRPLLLSGGGVAMLLPLEADERKAIVAENLARIRKASTARVQGANLMLQRSLRLGYGLHQGDIAMGLTAIGIPLALPYPWLQGSITAAGSSSDLSSDRQIGQVVKVLSRVAAEFQQRIPARL